MAYLEGGRQRVEAEERTTILDEAIHRQLAKGGRIESRTKTQAIVKVGKPKKGFMSHLFMTLITIGLWAPIWLIDSMSGGEKGVLLKVDEYGTVTEKRV